MEDIALHSPTGATSLTRGSLVATKRKANNDIVEGYERERKKRLAASVDSLKRNERHERPQQPQSIKDLPGMSAGPSRTRMQHLAGGTSRPTTPAKKTTKADEYNKRFLQELIAGEREDAKMGTSTH